MTDELRRLSEWRAEERGAAITPGTQPLYGKPHRLSLSDILTMVLNRSSHDSESVEISRNAKGEFQFSVTARTSEGETLDDAMERCSGVAGQLIARFPYTNSGV